MGVFTHAVITVSKSVEGGMENGLTFLDEGETFAEFALVADKGQPTIMVRLLVLLLLVVNFRSVWDTLADDTVRVDVDELLKILSGVGFTNVSGEGATSLIRLIIRIGEIEIKVVVPLRISTESGIIFSRSDINGSTTLPSTDDTSTDKFGTFFGCHTLKDFSGTFLGKESVEFGDELSEFTECEEGAVFCEFGSTSVGFITEEDEAWVDGILTFVGLGEVLDTRLGDTVEETEAVLEVSDR